MLGTAVAPMPERVRGGSLQALNLLGNVGDVRFETGHYIVLLQHSSRLGWVQMWRVGKASNFTPHWGDILALPVPVYNPQAQLLYESGTRMLGTGLCVVHPKTPTKIAATGATQGATGAAEVVTEPAGAPTAGNHFKQAMAAVQIGASSMREGCSPQEASSYFER